MVKNLSHIHFRGDAAVQKNIMNQLKSAYPSGTITTEKRNISDKDIERYLAFKYKSSNVEIFNDQNWLMMISPQAAQSIVDAYNKKINLNKSEEQKKMKVF